MPHPADRTLQDELERCIEPFKGLLILIVILDHNNEAHAAWNDLLLKPLTFHVLGFLLLPFLTRQPRLTPAFVADRLVRYGVPQLWTVTVASLLYWIVYASAGSPAEFLERYAAAALIGSATLIKSATGYLAFWFLPALTGMVIVLAAFRALRPPWRTAALVLFVAAHLFMVASLVPGYSWVPFGLPIVANVFVLGMLLSAIARAGWAYRVRFLFPLALAAAYVALATSRVWLEVATLELAPVTRPVALLLQDVTGVAGIVTVLLASKRLMHWPVLRLFGRYSLVVYLLHPFFYVGVERISSHFGALGVLATGMIEYVCAAALSLAGAIVIAHSAALSAWLTPRAWREWAPVSRLQRTRA